MTLEADWWRKAIVYQLIVPSFKDSDGDGHGDLGGVLEKLDYLKWLGIDAIWLSPIYASPLRELGYDVSDYFDIEPAFGTLETFDALVSEAHRLGLRVILDWVPNHTSDRHAWFRESSSARGSAKRDWYIWRDARPDGSPPNNWVSVFGGSVWQWHEATGQYYLHTFLPSQADLNWRNPDVRAAMHATLRFWLERDVDGFRVDAACLLMKDEQFRDNPPNPDYRPGFDGPDNRLEPEHTRDQPCLHEALAEIREVVEGYGSDRVLLGEIYLGTQKLRRFYGSADRPELHLPLDMLLAWTEWSADALGHAIADYQSSVPPHGWPASLLSTHDQSRIAMRTPQGQARVAAMLLMTQRGAISHYYGEEIGMQGVDIPAERALDPQGRRTGRNRDPERTPMQWSTEAGGGFTSGEPWLPIGDDLPVANVAAQRGDPRSPLSLFRRLIRLRREHPVLVGGTHVPVVSQPGVLAYRREDEHESLLVLLNLTSAEQRCKLDGTHGRVLISTIHGRDGERADGALALAADEGAVVMLDAPPVEAATESRAQ